MLASELRLERFQAPGAFPFDLGQTTVVLAFELLPESGRVDHNRDEFHRFLAQRELLHVAIGKCRVFRDNALDDRHAVGIAPTMRLVACDLGVDHAVEDAK